MRSRARSTGRSIWCETPLARRRRGSRFALVSDHFHPWIDRQGQSPFVWSVLGGIALATEQLVVGTGRDVPDDPDPSGDRRPGGGDRRRRCCRAGSSSAWGRARTSTSTCSATAGRATAVRREMLEEAIEVMRLLWRGGLVSHSGSHYTVENARLYTLPEEPIEVMVAAGGPEAAELAGRIGDGSGRDRSRRGAGAMRSTTRGARRSPVTGSSPSAGRSARRMRGKRPTSGGRTLRSAARSARSCRCRRTSRRPRRWSTRDDVAEPSCCGPDPERHAEAIDEFVDAGYTHVYVHQVGPDQDGFFAFYEEQLLPRYATTPVAGRA